MNADAEMREIMKNRLRWTAAVVLCSICLSGAASWVPGASVEAEETTNLSRGIEMPDAALPQQTEIPMPPATVLPPQTIPTPSATVLPPQIMPTAMPSMTQMPSEKPSKALTLKNKGAKYFSGGQKGIGVGRVKKQKIYHINTYVTDAVKLIPSHKATFRLTGAANKKELKSGRIKVSSDGTVRCRNGKKGKYHYAIVGMTSKETGECKYVYLSFAPEIYGKSSQKQLIYQGKTAKLGVSYPCRQVAFSSSNEKVAKVSKKGVVTARKKGKAVIRAKVKKSEKNEIAFKISVKEEPWIVDDKDSVYSYEDMTGDLRSLAGKYSSHASLQNLGNSEDGRSIWCLRIGNPSAGQKLLLNAGIHAREWLNPQMVMRKSEEILRQYPDYQKSLRSTCLYVVPMINPDGIAIAQSGFGAIRSPKLRKICQKTKASHRTWKANARGVNLNFNFPGGFNKKGKPKKPDGINYPGKKAASEKETKIMMSLINRYSGWRGSLNYHSTGSILYWNYNVEDMPSLYGRQKALAEKVNSFNHYRLMPKSISTDPNGGFGDWLIYNKHIPNVTVETGTVMCPLPFSQFKRIMKQNTELLTWFARDY